MNNFHVGQKVVCVNDKLPRTWDADDATAVPHWVKLHHVYTVRDITMMLYQGVPDAKPAIRLIEIQNPIVTWVQDNEICEYAFAAYRFRPVRQTDISIFTSMLAPKPRELVTGE